MSSDPLVLVSGASGFIATHVIKQLLEGGYRVRGTVRSLKDPQKVQYLYNLVPQAKDRLELVEADLMKHETWMEAVKGVTYVLHLASPFPAANPKTEEEVVKPAVEGTLNVLKSVAVTGGIKRVVVTSSLAAVAEKGGNTVPFDETHWADPTFPHMMYYNRSKIYAEKAAWDYLKERPSYQKFEMCTINPTIVIGPPLHTTAGTSVEVMSQLLEHKIPALPKFNIAMCDVRDVARAHIAAMTNPDAAGQRHIINSVNIWYKDFAKVVEDEFKDQGYNVPTNTIPGCVMTAAGWFSGTAKATMEFGGQPILLDNYRMVHVLGVKPVDYKQSILDMGYGVIECGFVKKTKKYKGAPANYLEYPKSK